MIADNPPREVSFKAGVGYGKDLPTAMEEAAGWLRESGYESEDVMIRTDYLPGVELFSVTISGPWEVVE